LVPFFGTNLQIRQLSTEKIAAYEEGRIKEVPAWTVRNELTVLRHLLRLSHRKWGYLDRVPEIELPKAPRGRTRYLNEIAKLLKAPPAHQRTSISRPSSRWRSIMGLTWERVDLAKDLGFGARITLYDTKNGEARGLPLNKAAIRTAFKKAVERADLPDFRFHTISGTLRRPI
jgi:hypothetical protein